MASERIRTIAKAGLLAASGACLVAGCANPGPIAARQNTVGSLKTSVSQLQYDNINLRKQLADIRSEATRAESKLVQAEDEIQRRDGGVASITRSSSKYANSDTGPVSADDDIPPPVQSPVHRSRGGRKPPAAQIPRIIPRAADPGPGQIIHDQGTYDLGPQASRFIDDSRWLPVARGNSRGGSVEVR